MDNVPVHLFLESCIELFMSLISRIKIYIDLAFDPFTGVVVKRKRKHVRWIIVLQILPVELQDRIAIGQDDTHMTKRAVLAVSHLTNEPPNV